MVNCKHMKTLESCKWRLAELVEWEGAVMYRLVEDGSYFVQGFHGRSRKA